MASRSIEVEKGLRMRFPGRGMAFADGVEIGIIAALMSARTPEFEREIAAGNVEQARVLAGKLGYHLAELEPMTAAVTRVSFRSRALAPKLRLVASRG